MEQQEKKSPSLQWKKIWEVDTSFKCPLIGTCLGRFELRRLSRERVYAVESGLDDYQLHTRFIAIAARDDIKGRALHKYLRKKYHQSTKKYLQATTDDDIRSHWQEDMTAGRIDSAWWAVMTHPLISEQLVDELYGFLHMLGHEYINGYHKEQTRRATLRNKVTMLEEILGSERQHHRREQRQLRGEITDLRQEAEKYQVLMAENSLLRAEKAVLKERAHQLTVKVEEASDQQQPAAGQEELARLREEHAQQGQEVARLRQQVAAMEAEQARMARQRTDQAREIASLESMLLQRMSDPDPCTVCADHNTAQCPGLSLCGKTVLYVGGLHKMVPHYRQLVEQLGGRFMHHDGGKEASRNLLPKMLVTADAVFCPIDCVSHDACKQVKKMCKRYRKPFVLMRSSGLSSLAKGLNEIVQ
ncbi:DUF2325 domain-containing protein [Desulfobulbus alkaliphilus]|uniref:DUF2325 domain-containing protein n=1 Tax=Desulfobulbus alkaliphilus TaxID=869814 RepID=UPI0019667459|nr:DUF2325 domain-containing protein [Desulfobulbus alkaliphilus]MBM9538777.1 DUF2325 domain-containing protein [Desulfobulbus alkaliphilus]